MGEKGKRVVVGGERAPDEVCERQGDGRKGGTGNNTSVCVQ